MDMPKGTHVSRRGNAIFEGGKGGERKLEVGILRRNSWLWQVGTSSHIDHQPPISQEEEGAIAAKPRTRCATSQTAAVFEKNECT